MTIDIIDYTEEQLSKLTFSQRMKVYQAQTKKNRLAIKLEEDLLKERDRLLKNGTFYSKMYELVSNKLGEEFNMEEEFIRQQLLYDLSKGQADVDASGVPYTVDYALSYDDRYVVVRDYYIDAYQDDAERFNVFLADDFAVGYLGDLYSTLYDYLYVLAYG